VEVKEQKEVVRWEIGGGGADEEGEVEVAETC